jgi:hypothetical protein
LQLIVSSRFERWTLVTALFGAYKPADELRMNL